MNNAIWCASTGFMVLLLAALWSATGSNAARVVTPSELAALQQQMFERIRVMGRVTVDAPVYAEEGRERVLLFAVQDPGSKGPGQSLPVRYRGLKPDLLAPGRDVIIDGEYRDGRIFASSVLTKCPSKYEAARPEK